MARREFPAGSAPRIIIGEVGGDLDVRVWDERQIAIETDEGSLGAVREGDALAIEWAESDVRMWLPSGAELSVEKVRGDAAIAGVRALSLGDVRGDLELRDIAEPVRLRSVHGELEAASIPSLTVERGIGDDAELTDVGSVTIDAVGGDLELSGVGSAALGSVGGGCEAHDVAEAFSYRSVGGDLEVFGSGAATVTGGDVGGDLELAGLGSAQVASVGGDAELRDVRGALQIGNIGGDLETEAAFPTDRGTRLVVGGDASIDLRASPNVTIRATVGGEVTGEGLVTTGSGGTVKAVYGSGAAQVDIIVGGDLLLSGARGPRASSADWGDFEREMEHFGEEMGRLGEEIGRAFSGWSAGQAEDWARKGQQRAEKIRRKVEAQINRAAGRARRAEDEDRRVRVRINDREWVFDQERLERMKEQARAAAHEGITGAMAAIERAFAGMGIPPTPPAAPESPPAPGAPPAPDAPPAPATGQTIRIDVEPSEERASVEGVQAADSAATSNPEEERAAILRMVAEGRISPEEGDMLLDALG